jgi:hypothetical protein
MTPQAKLGAQTLDNMVHLRLCGNLGKELSGGVMTALPAALCWRNCRLPEPGRRLTYPAIQTEQGFSDAIIEVNGAQSLTQTRGRR